ncbi:hypothetical protein BJ165DRAFT_1521719 [Panaeolus papilionaceus]|nr:hypothetical protein BJ165DRAFT_1521719 [Panaeolus papilionaceus]
MAPVALRVLGYDFISQSRKYTLHPLLKNTVLRASWLCQDFDALGYKTEAFHTPVGRYVKHTSQGGISPRSHGPAQTSIYAIVLWLPGLPQSLLRDLMYLALMVFVIALIAAMPSDDVVTGPLFSVECYPTGFD